MSKLPTLEACWLDQAIGEPGTHRPLKQRFETVSSRIVRWHYFDCGDNFTEFLDSNPNVRLVAITSGAFAKTLIPTVSNRDSLDSVYVFCGNLSKYQSLQASEPKMKGVFNDEDELFNQMQNDLGPESSWNKLMCFSFV